MTGLVTAIDHLVLTVRDIEASVDFYARALGIEAVLATDLAHARGVSLRTDDAQPIGPGCARCHREGCSQRSLPPLGRKLAFDRTRRGVTPFEFEVA